MGVRVNVMSPEPKLTELAAEVVGRNAMIKTGATAPIGHVGDSAEVAVAAASSHPPTAVLSRVVSSYLLMESWPRFEKLCQQAISPLA